MTVLESARKLWWKGSSPGDEGTAKRFRLANGDDVCRSNSGAVPDRSSPDPASPFRGPHHGHDPSPDGFWQAMPDVDNLGQVRGHRVGFALVLPSTPGTRRVKPGFFESCPC
jgi:hypothetical protein